MCGSDNFFCLSLFLVPVFYRFVVFREKFAAFNRESTVAKTLAKRKIQKIFFLDFFQIFEIFLAFLKKITNWGQIGRECNYNCKWGEKW